MLLLLANRFVLFLFSSYIFFGFISEEFICVSNIFFLSIFSYWLRDLIWFLCLKSTVGLLICFLLVTIVSLCSFALKQLFPIKAIINIIHE